MPIIIDDEQLDNSDPPAPTIGQVLEQIKRNQPNRLVVQVLIDGEEPELPAQWNQPVSQRTMFVHTADRRQLATDALASASRILEDSDAHRLHAIENLSAGDSQQAMQPLAQWFASWQQVPKAVLQSAQAVGLALDQNSNQQSPISKLIADLAIQLRQIQTALQSKDYVTLSDILNYEAPEHLDQWRQIIHTTRQTCTQPDSKTCL